jgi:hypothetical protein
VWFSFCFSFFWNVIRGLSGITSRSFIQFTLGLGKPTALHSNLTVDPSSTVSSFGSFLTNSGAEE